MLELDPKLSPANSVIPTSAAPGSRKTKQGTAAEQAELELQMTLPLEPKPEEPAADWRAQVPTISQLTRRIRGHLENTFFDVWVRGEISNFRKPGSGHAYFCLKDASAQLKAVMFRPALSKLKFQVQDGMEILLHGKLTVYEARGEYQMVADALEPVGAGALQLAFEQLKLKLQKEGLFDAKFKKKLPHLPQRIGVVTSATGAAVRDILKVLSRRYPNRHLFILPASVQGEKAAAEIVAALTLAEKWNLERPALKIDVLIVGRGGGSLEDLWPFNEEMVARAIFGCGIPIISAVGHEIDFTIADFVADLRAPTPSAAAEVVIPRKDELAYQVQSQSLRLRSLMQKQLEQLRLHLGHLSNRLVDPRQKVRNLKQSFQLLEEKLTIALRTRLLLSKKRVEATVHVLDSLSPLKVIGRGYSITQTNDGAIVHTVDDTQVGQFIQTRVSDGVIESQVLTKNKKQW